MKKIQQLVLCSAALEGCSLNAAECELLLGKGISSAGKTIKEQLLCLDLQEAYRQCFGFASDHEFWSSFRLKNLASAALRHSLGCKVETADEAALSKVCEIANRQRLHISEKRSEEMYRASFEIHYIISESRPWDYGNDLMARLLMHYLQYECRLEPTLVNPSRRGEYKRILRAATSEEIGEIFVSYMLEHRCDPLEEDAVSPHPIADLQPRKVEYIKKAPDAVPAEEVKKAAAVMDRPKARVAALKQDKPESEGKRSSSRGQILSLLREHPYMSARDLAAAIGISAKGVEKNLGILKAEGALKRIGPDKGGRWEVA